MPGLARSVASTQPLGERTLAPRPLSSQTKSTGIRRPVWSYQPAVLNAAVALAWLTEASPNEQTTMASGGQGERGGCPTSPAGAAPAGRPAGSRRRSRSRARPTPTARGRCEAMVEVVGTTARSARPKTLCRPPAIGSRAEATMPRSTSRAAPAYASSGSVSPAGPAPSAASPRATGSADGPLRWTAPAELIGPAGTAEPASVSVASVSVSVSAAASGSGAASGRPGSAWPSGPPSSVLLPAGSGKAGSGKAVRPAARAARRQ